jgi:hypothetical protein
MSAGRLDPPWREGLDDSDDVGADLTQFRETHARLFPAVDDLEADAELEEELGGGVPDRTDTADWCSYAELGIRVQLEVHFTGPRLPLDESDRLDRLSNDEKTWETKLVFVGVV